MFTSTSTTEYSLQWRLHQLLSEIAAEGFTADLMQEYEDTHRYLCLVQAADGN